MGVFYCYRVELYPSEFRGIGCAFCTVLGRLGNVLAPLFVSLLISVGILP